MWRESARKYTTHFSWTGYAGMECTTDLEQFEETLRSQYKVELAVTSQEDKPGQPNPDFGPRGPGPQILDEYDEMVEQTSLTAGS